MSEPREKQQVMNFFTVVLQDEALLSQLMAALDTKDDAAIMAMASERDYHFSQTSLHQGLKDILNLVSTTKM